MVQLTFGERPRRDGAKRKTLGRKPGLRPKVRHLPRPAHRASVPLHVTMRAMPGLPSFRRPSLYAAFERAFRTTRREGFRIVEFSVQANHVHLIVEAESNEALGRGMKSFSVRANRLFNSAMRRGRGRVWSDRYHRQDLETPRQVRNALVYCLCNFKKHGSSHLARPCGPWKGRPVIDACSSARWFQGWTDVRRTDDGEPPTEPPATWLLRIAWRRHGLIHPGESPALQVSTEAASKPRNRS